MPSIFGFQLGPGQGYVEALTPEQQHQVSWLMQSKFVSLKQVLCA
jgi:hypothetical protein